MTWTWARTHQQGVGAGVVGPYISAMNQAPVRQLSAIMFADIVGYTAMMQRSEADAVASRDRFREVLAEMAVRSVRRLIEKLPITRSNSFNARRRKTNHSSFSFLIRRPIHLMTPIPTPGVKLAMAISPTSSHKQIAMSVNS